MYPRNESKKPYGKPEFELIMGKTTEVLHRLDTCDPEESARY